MSVLRVQSNKNIELLDLEVHVVMCEQRRIAMEEKIKDINDRVNDIEAQRIATKRLMIGAIISIATGVISTIVSILVRNL